MSEEDALDLKPWERAGRDTLAAASISDETAIKILKPCRLVMDLLEQLKREQEAKMAEGLL